MHAICTHIVRTSALEHFGPTSCGTDSRTCRERSCRDLCGALVRGEIRSKYRDSGQIVQYTCCGRARNSEAKSNRHSNNDGGKGRRHTASKYQVGLFKGTQGRAKQSEHSSSNGQKRHAKNHQCRKITVTLTVQYPKKGIMKCVDDHQIDDPDWHIQCDELDGRLFGALQTL